MFTPLQILQQYWGYTSFRDPQEKIIDSVLNNKDTIALLPTGGGKSICFQIPALIKNGVCIVISPLIALMQNQVESLQIKNIKATTIESGMTQDEIIVLFDNIRFGNYKFLYISPERLQSKFIQDKIAQLEVSLIAIDEAHCISEWGHDFRPSYLDIFKIREIHPKVPVIALTATANNQVLNDISNQLQLKEVEIFKKSFYRDNLAYQVHYTDDKLFKLNQIFNKTKGGAIVYVNTRKKTQTIAKYLIANGFKASSFHGGMLATEKKAVLQNWLANETPIIVATNAFGMGIDKPDVRVVVHFDIPNSIENYVQESGRAGRDHKKAFAVTLTNKADIHAAEKLFKYSIPTLEEVKNVHKKLYQHCQISFGELPENAFNFNFLAFCTKYSFTSNKAFTAIQILHNNGIIQFNNTHKQKSTIQFLVNSKQIINYSGNNLQRKKFINALLRMYSGLFEQDVKIDEYYLAKKAGVTSWTAIELLESLHQEGYINYQKSNNDSELVFLHPREDDKTINRIAKNIQTYLEQKDVKHQQIINFITRNSVCRSIQLLSYFNETSSKKCNMCDVCLKEKNASKTGSQAIINLLKEKKEATAKEMCTQLNLKEADILINLRYLLSEEIIGLNNYNQYFLR